MIIGQTRLRGQIDKLLESSFPRFSIISGPKGSGKKLFAEYIANRLEISPVYCGLKIDEVREMIQTAYTQKVPALYIFPDTDNMSINAKNSLLKVTEEPPVNSYFLMTVVDKNKALGTILSRGVMFNIDPYTPADIRALIKEFNYELKTEDELLIQDICQSPGDINTLVSYKVSDFYDYCERVLDNISEVEGANAFKIAGMLDTKGEGWDIRLFFETMSVIALHRLKCTKDLRYYNCIKVCSKYKRDLSITGINKQILIDAWILEMRKVL